MTFTPIRVRNANHKGGRSTFSSASKTSQGRVLPIPLHPLGLAGKETNPHNRNEKDSFLSHPDLGGRKATQVIFKPLLPRELLAVAKTEPRAWVWEPYLPQGSLSLFSAYMKVGKSTLIYELALAVARGEIFLGSPTERGRVLILAVEEHPRDVRQRLRKLGLGEDDDIRLWLGPLDPNMLPDVRKYVVKRRVTLVILDTLASYWQITNENDNAEVIRKVGPLEALARDTGAAVVLIHHDRKGGGADGESIRGGSGLFGKVDQALMLRRVKNYPTRRKLLRDGRYNDDSPPALLLDRRAGRYISLGTPATGSTSSDRRSILTLLKAGPQTVQQMMKHIRIKRKKLDARLEQLKKSGRIVRSASGVKGDPHVWKLTKRKGGTRCD